MSKDAAIKIWRVIFELALTPKHVNNIKKKAFTTIKPNFKKSQVK